MPKHTLSRKGAAAKLEVKQCDLDLKAETDGESAEFLTVTGYGSVFGVKDNGGDIVVPGAFQDSIASGRKVKMLWQHDPSQVIGTWDEVREDANGLHMKGRVSKKAAKGAEVAALVKMGALDGLSIGYRTLDYEMDATAGARKLTKLDLWETSVVTFPMNELAGIHDMKSADDMNDAEIKRHFERALKEIGVSGTMAKAMAAGAMEGRKSVLRDAGALSPENDQREADELKAKITELLQNLEPQK